MKPLPFNIPKTEKESFRVQIDRMPYFYDRLHHHPEIQITLIREGTGTRFIGDHTGRFQPGDIFIIGPQVPHLLKSDQEYFQENPTLWASSVSVFFSEESFGKGFFDLPELHAVRELLERASFGLEITGESRIAIEHNILNLANTHGLERFNGLFSLLQKLTEAPGLRALSNTPFLKMTGEKEGERLNSVIQYVMENYQKQVTLEEIAGVASLSVPAFCRYFKLRTRKTFINFLNEVRLGFACKMLLAGTLPISEISFRCGFHNLSHFNRLFRAHTGQTPSTFRKRQGLG